MTLKNEEYVCVYYPVSSQEVALIKMILERERIPYFIKNERLHGAVLFSVPGPGNIELHVPQQYAGTTVEILKADLDQE